jgi:hypothetical protein
LATCRADAKFDELVDTMLGRHGRRVPIVDEKVQLIGIVCMDDVIAALVELMQRASQALTGERTFDRAAVHHVACMQMTRCRPYASPDSVGQQHRQRGVLEHMSGRTAKYQLAYSRVTPRAHHQQICMHGECLNKQRFTGIGYCRELLHRVQGNALPREPVAHRQGRWSDAGQFVAGTIDKAHAFGPAQKRHGSA